MRRMKEQEKGKSTLHAEKDFVEKLESMTVDPLLSRLIQKYQEIFGALPPPLSCKNWSRWTSNSNPSLKGLW